MPSCRSSPSDAIGLVSIVVSIPACHAGDPGSIPGLGAVPCCNVGLVVEYDPATVETRVRFPDVANDAFVGLAQLVRARC